MKSHCCSNREKPTAIDLSALLNLMSPERSHGVFEDVNLEGRSNGAVMNARRSSSGKSSDSCGINVYINNNVQGVCNSILVGSEVHMGDPGVSLSLKPMESGKIFRGSKNGSGISTLGLIFGLMFVFVALLRFILMN